jgi:hypothetical protein
MVVILDSAQPTPCQFSVQGSPPFVTHPGSVGDPSAVYKPFIANTVNQINKHSISTEDYIYKYIRNYTTPHKLTVQYNQ